MTSMKSKARKKLSRFDECRRLALIVDLDGTLADACHRVGLITKEEPDWDKFFDEMRHDKINPWCYEMVCAFKAYRGHDILFVTGRPEKYRELTTHWLHRNKVPFDHVYMRQDGDYRHDYNVKEDIYYRFIRDEFDVTIVLEDRTDCARMWRANGLVCLQCSSDHALADVNYRKVAP